MRIDGYGSSYPLTPATRQRPELRPAADVPPARPVPGEPASDAGRQGQPAISSDPAQALLRGSSAPVGAQAVRTATGELAARPMSSRAAQALASYGSTASMLPRQGAEAVEVVGLDLYA